MNALLKLSWDELKSTLLNEKIHQRKLHQVKIQKSKVAMTEDIYIYIYIVICIYVYIMYTFFSEKFKVTWF